MYANTARRLKVSRVSSRPAASRRDFAAAVIHPALAVRKLGCVPLDRVGVGTAANRAEPVTSVNTVSRVIGEAQMWKQDLSPRQEPLVKPEGTRQAQTRDTREEEERRVVAWVGKSVVFKGDLTSSEDMTIDGRVEGTITLLDHGLTIGPHAEIRADILVKTVIVRGAVIGMITAGDSVVVSETGSVEGDIVSPRLALADGAVLRGRVDTATRQTEANEVRRLAPVP
jgi:cytoskeletal protein CcmA (bactofilin family)